jgi:hypothetical protein
MVNATQPAKELTIQAMDAGDGVVRLAPTWLATLLREGSVVK